MHRLLLAAFLVLAPLAASAQDMNAYNQALAAFNAGKLDDAAPRFFELASNAVDSDVRARSIVIDRNGAHSEIFLPANAAGPTIYVR